MTDQFGSFQCLLDSENPYRVDVITQFYKQHQSDVQVMDKWFSAQCISSVSSVENVRSLMKHELFSMTNPNRIRSVIGSFSQNSIQFHCQEGYQLNTLSFKRANSIQLYRVIIFPRMFMRLFILR